MQFSKITIEAQVAAPVQKVWSFFTEPKHITQWNFADPSWQCPWVTNDLKLGGQYTARMEAKDGSFGFEFSAIYEHIILEKKISYKMSDGRKVTTEFQYLGDHTKIITIFDAEKENPEAMQKQGWQAILDNFKQYVEKN
ncbi:MAG: SRPBCC family protein [Proteobacteria bacterium]|nr:SRPBCC family protein [Pseudomonadota bacterium]